MRMHVRCVFICIYIHTHVYICICIYFFTCIRIEIYIYVYTHKSCTQMCICKYVCCIFAGCICTLCIYVCMYVCMYVCLYVCMCICTHVYTHNIHVHVDFCHICMYVGVFTKVMYMYWKLSFLAKTEVLGVCFPSKSVAGFFEGEQDPHLHMESRCIQKPPSTSDAQALTTGSRRVYIYIYIW